MSGNRRAKMGLERETLLDSLGRLEGATRELRAELASHRKTQDERNRVQDRRNKILAWAVVLLGMGVAIGFWYTWDYAHQERTEILVQADQLAYDLCLRDNEDRREALAVVENSLRASYEFRGEVADGEPGPTPEAFEAFIDSIMESNEALFVPRDCETLKPE
jgi:hypothetical protein